MNLLFKIGIVILAVGLALAVVPFKDEIVRTENKITISDWEVSWYYLQSDPMEEGFTSSYLRTSAIYLGNSTFPPVFWYNWGDEPVFEGFGDQIGFIARAEMTMPIDGYVKFEVASADGARLYIDGELIIDIWETRWGQSVGSGSATVEVKAGKHELELQVYCWGWAVAGFNPDLNIMVLEKRSDPLIGLGVACVGGVLMAIDRLKASSKPKGSQ